MQFDAKFFTILVFVAINFLILFIVKTRTTLVISVIIAHLIAWFDRWIVDGILVGGIAKASSMAGAGLSRWQSGKVQSYWILVFVTFGLFLLFTILQRG
jgi:hypothetical protein